MRKNVKRTIAVLSAVCMLPCPQVANVAVMAQNVSVGSSIGSKILKQSLQTSTNFETASGKRQEVKENNIEDSYDITYGDSIFFVLRQKHLIKIKQIFLVMKMIRNRMMGRKIRKQM